MGFLQKFSYGIGGGRPSILERPVFAGLFLLPIFIANIGPTEPAGVSFPCVFDLKLNAIFVD
jgi:hypothetical protein